jgi:IclR family transcriptional regulator, pca regulon regulatory protein
MQYAPKRPNIARRRDYVVALARGLEVMRAYSDNKEVMTLAEIAKAVNLPRATARRSLITLEALGYVSGDGKFYRLAPKVLTLARAYLSSNLLPRAAYPFLESLSAELGGVSSSVSILHEWEVIYVARSSNRRLNALLGDVGSRRPAYCTSMGRVLLAYLPAEELDEFFRQAELKRLTKFTLTDEDKIRKVLTKVKEQEYCLSDQETELDLRTIAVPLRNSFGRVIAAVHVATQASRTGKRPMIDRYLPALRKTASEIRALLV